MNGDGCPPPGPGTPPEEVDGELGEGIRGFAPQRFSSRFVLKNAGPTGGRHSHPHAHPHHHLRPHHHPFPFPRGGGWWVDGAAGASWRRGSAAAWNPWSRSTGALGNDLLGREDPASGDKQTGCWGGELLVGAYCRPCVKSRGGSRGRKGAGCPPPAGCWAVELDPPPRVPSISGKALLSTNAAHSAGSVGRTQGEGEGSNRLDAGVVRVGGRPDASVTRASHGGRGMRRPAGILLRGGEDHPRFKNGGNINSYREKKIRKKKAVASAAKGNIISQNEITSLNLCGA